MKNFFLKNYQSLLLGLLSLFLAVFFYKQNLAVDSLKKELIKNLNFYKNQQTKEKEELKQQLSLLREELIRYKSQQEGRDQILALTMAKNQTKNDVLSGSTGLNEMVNQADELISTIAGNIKVKGIVKLKNNWLKAEVYDNPRAGSKVIGEIVQNKLYFVYDEVSGWYKIEYREGQFGWIQNSLVENL